MFLNRNSRCIWLTVFSLLILLTPSLFAQTSATGALTGTVTDPTGSVVANVKVTATNTGTGQERLSITGSDGSYKINLLSPGTYLVQFEATGFNALTIPSVTVTVTETNVVDGHLTVGAQTQAITVEGEAEESVQTTSAAVGTVMAGKNIADLPLTSRNYTNLLGLSAGSNAGDGRRRVAEKVVGIQDRVSEEFKCGPMKLIGARFCDHVHVGAGFATVARVE